MDTNRSPLVFDSSANLHPWHWGVVATIGCLLPGLLMAAGVDFSTHLHPFGTGAIPSPTPGQFTEVAHAVLRGNYTHTLLEWTAVCSAAFVALLAIVQFRITKEPSLPVIGVALACAGAMDAFHTLAADRLIEVVADNKNLIPFTWAICRLFNGTILALGVGMFVLVPTLKTKVGAKFILMVCVCFLAIAYFIIHYCATSGSLPQTMFPGQAIKRPYDLYPLIPYAICGFVVFPMYWKQHRSIFAVALTLSVIPHVATQLYMAFGSFRLHDSCFNIAHGLKAVAYMTPAGGLLLGFIRINQLRIRTATLATMNADVGIALTSISNEPSQDALQKIANIVSARLDAALVRIWTVDETDSAIEPRATAAHGDIALSFDNYEPFADTSFCNTDFTVQQHHTNDAAHDDLLNQNWVSSHSIVSFLAQPLNVEGRPVGILTVCAQQPLNQETLDTLAMIADGLALAIDRKRANAWASKSATETQLINRGTTIAATAKSFEHALAQITDMVCEVTGWSIGHVYLRDSEDCNILISTEIWHCPRDDNFSNFQSITERTRFRIGEGLPGRVFQIGKPIWLSNIHNDAGFLRCKTCADIGLRTAFGIPVISSGEVAAILEFFTTQELPPDEGLLDLIGTVGSRVGQVLERQQTEQALRDAEAHTRGILNNAVDCIITINDEGIVESFNQAAENLFYYKAEEVIGKNVKLLMPSPYHDDHDNYLNTYLETGVRQIIGIGREVTGRRKDGTKFPMELSVGETILSDRRMFTGIIRDIAERKQVEQDLHESAMTLEARSLDLEFAQAQLQGAADFGSALNQSDAMSTYRAALACMVESISAPLAAIFIKEADGKLKPTCAIGIDQGLLSIDNLKGEGLPREVLGTGQIKIINGPFNKSNIQLQLGIGKIVPTCIIGWPITFQEKCIGVLITVHSHPLSEQEKAVIIAALEQLAIRMNAFLIEDQRITLMGDLKRKSEDLEEAKRIAEQSSRVKSEFLANMSHELRTPMNSIIGFTHRLIKRLDGTITERDIDALQTVDRNAKHLLGLINDILDLSKIEAGKIELSKSVFNLVDLVDEILVDSSTLVDSKPIELIFPEPYPLIQIEADRTKIRQVLTNILSNSIKYTDQGTVTLKVYETDDWDLGHCACVSVVDTGVGIKPEDQKRLFKKFTQLDASATRRAGGTGLGLVITAQYVQMHGGKITVQSEYGQGSEFTVVLPHTMASRPTTTHQPTRRRLEAVKRPTIGINILCVDNDPDVLKKLKTTFVKIGYHVDLAPDVDSAITMAQQHKPDLICLDTPSSSKQNYEMLQKIRKHKYLSTTPIIAIALSTDDPGALANQGVSFVNKFVSPEELLIAVRKILADGVNSALIVDDDPDARQLLASELHANGAKVHTASNGLEALQALDTFAPQVILLDLMMPVMSGIELLEKLITVPTWSQIPVVVITAKLLDKDELALLAKLDATIVTKGQKTVERTIDAIFCTLKNQALKTEALTA